MFTNENNEEVVVINCDQNLQVSAIYDDEISDLLQNLGSVKIQRASHVEPTEDGQWQADLSPVDGPVLGPFLLRKDALDAEVAWLMENIFNVQCNV